MTSRPEHRLVEAGLSVCVPLLVTWAALTSPAAQAIDAKCAKQLERSGCTQLTERQGCDLNKTREENASAGFTPATAASAAIGAASTASAASPARTPCAGQWVAKSTTGATVSTIRINAREQVWVNGERVKARRSDGALVFRGGTIQYVIQGDRRLQGEDPWRDSAAGTQGPIVAE